MGTSTRRWVLATTTVVLLLVVAIVAFRLSTVVKETKPKTPEEELHDRLAKSIEKALTNTVMKRLQEAIKMDCQGVYAEGKITPAQLKIVLDLHQAWRRDFNTEQKRNSTTAQEDKRRANLCRTDMSGSELSYEDLSWADMNYANLSGARLTDVNLSGAKLTDANLSGADLGGVNLSGADLTNANLSGVRLEYANLSGVLFVPSELPLIDTIATAKNLEQMYHIDNAQALIKLRKAFDDTGYHEQARKINFAIKRSEYLANPASVQNASVMVILKKELGWSTTETNEQGRGWRVIEDAFKYVFFDVPTQWGMFPGRALRILIVLIGIFSLPYVVVLRYPRTGCIYRKWGTENPSATTATSTWRSKNQPTTHHDVGIEALHYPWPKAIRRGLQFSLLSAFHIGFREFNVGNWISRLQSRDYTLYATGWVRSVAGTQSLISVYLLAMWALTYFGRPFD